MNSYFDVKFESGSITCLTLFAILTAGIVSFVSLSIKKYGREPAKQQRKGIKIGRASCRERV